MIDANEQKKRKVYAVLISRYDENSEVTELVDQYITADDAIDLMLHIKENVSDAGAGEEEEEPKPIEKPRKKRGRPLNSEGRHDYNIHQARKEIKEGARPGEIAERHGVPVTTIYALKKRMKQDGEFDGATPLKATRYVTEAKEPTVAEIQQAKEQSKRKLKPVEQELVQAIEEGIDKSELLMMFPSIEAYRINDLIAAYGKY